MASVQLVKQRTKVAATRHTTAVSQKQSLELVQTTFLGALSILTYMRELLPDKAYVKRYYDTREDVLPYKEFAAGVMPRTEEDANGAHTILKLLQRGRSKRTDVFLDLLDIAFDEIKSGKLRAMQLLILANPERRSKVLETYTFTVEYTNVEGNPRTPSGFKVHAVDADTATVCSTTSALQEFLREMTDLCETLPQLPSKRYLGIELVYDKANVPQGRTSGYVTGRSSDLLFARAKGWERQTDPFALNSGFHSTTLSISHLQMQKNTGDQVDNDQNFPDEVDFKERVARFDIVKQNLEVGQALRVPAGGKAPWINTHDAPDSIATKQAANDTTQAHAGRIGISARPQSSTASKRSRTSSHTLAAFTSEQTGTQSSIIPEMKFAFQHMMQPEEISKGDTQTQGFLRQNSLPGDVASTTVSTHPSPIANDDRTAAAAGTMRLALSPSTRQEIGAQRPFLQMTSKSLARSVGGKTKDSESIVCLCGHAKEEGDMAQCHGCNTWQHLHCHGYVGSEDPRLPVMHACYACILGKSDADTYRKLQDLAIQRRAIFWVLHNGMRTKSDLSRDLDLDPKLASPVHTLLKKSDYIVGTSMSHKTGYRATGQPLFVPVKEGPAYENMFKAFFDPTTMIEKHYGGVTEAAIKQAAISLQRLIGSRADSMPPPATPYPGRKKKVTGTPNSNLDLATPVATFETPTLPGRHQTRGVKRSLDNDQEDPIAAKKLATPATGVRQFSTLMSAALIDAFGASSPLEAPSSTKKATR